MRIKIKATSHYILGPLFLLTLSFLLSDTAPGQNSLHRSDMTTDEVGARIGDRIPPIRARDQNGQWRDFDSLKGPKGVVISFNRSTDW